MDIEPQDWSLVQSFLAVAEAGSLSLAARRLGRSQPTLGRQIKTLEGVLSASLFERHARGLSLTQAGQDLLPLARQMRDAMNEITLRAAGRDLRVDGTVRLTSSVFACHYVLPAILADLRKAEPGILIDLVATDDSENLLFREADIAVRMYRPDQLDIVAQHVADAELGCFAAKSYLEQRGSPNKPEDLWHHELIGYDRNDLILREMADLGFPADRDAFHIRCDNQSAYWELVRSGCGIGFSQCVVGRADPLIEELSLGLRIPPMPVWLAAHERIRTTPRIRRVWDVIYSGLCELFTY